MGERERAGEMVARDASDGESSGDDDGVDDETFEAIVREARGRGARGREELERRPAWVSDVDADERRRKYALSEEEYAAKMASRVSKHIDEVRIQKYAQFEDAFQFSSSDRDDESDRDDGDATERDVRGVSRESPRSFDLDMALFWARRRADAGARALSQREARDAERSERRCVESQAKEIKKLRESLARETAQREKLTMDVERKTKEIARLRSQLAILKLRRDSERAETNTSTRLTSSTIKKPSDDPQELPLYAQFRSDEISRDAWFMRHAARDGFRRQ
jgi:hypothetical protein